MWLIGAHVLQIKISLTVDSFLQRVFSGPGIPGFVIDILVLSGFITVFEAPFFSSRETGIFTELNQIESAF